MKRLAKYLIIFINVLLSANSYAKDVLKLVTTTSTQNSGLTEFLVKDFTAETGIEVHTVAVGTGKALTIARNGDADVILVHSQPDEEKFVEEGFGLERFDIMYNDFIVVGPTTFNETSSVEDVLLQIESSESLFLSRGDDSGTHKKELALWQAANIAPNGQWHRESGQGMGKTLQIASELQAYALTDRGTWLAQNANQKLDLQIVFQGDENLFNPYGAVAVNPEKHAHVNINAANEFINWLMSETGQRLISEFTIDDQQLFFPSAN